jgi:pimeloyl-ACP methyl ester carboxylesterase
MWRFAVATTLHVDVTGRPTKGTLVLLHGFPLHGGMWQAQREALASAGWEVIVPDQRGFGRSPEAGPFTIAQLADDVHDALVQGRGLGKIVLAGLSMGGYVALAYAKKYAQTLRGLILLDTKAAGDDAEGKANRDRMIAIAKERGSKPIADAMFGKLIPEETARNRPQLAKTLRDMMESIRPQTIVYALAAMRDRTDQTGMLGQIGVPTFIGVGDQDAITPPDVARGMHEKIPGSQLRIFIGSGHMSPMEQSEQVNAAIAEFLSKLK